MIKGKIDKSAIIILIKYQKLFLKSFNEYGIITVGKFETEQLKP